VPIEIIVTDTKRVDKIVREKLSYASLSDIFKLFRRGDIKLDKKKVKGKEIAESGSHISIYADEKWLRANAKKKKADQISTLVEKNISVIYEDDHLFVLDKPSGVSVQDGKGVPSGTSLEDLAKHYASNQTPPFKTFLVHRLDAETSGAILFTKTDAYLQTMIDLFKKKMVTKTYLALCHGRFRKTEGIINVALKRTETKSQGMKVRVSSNGKDAHSEFKVLKQYKDMALVEINILTGRTHQIRVHMEYIGHPVVGDKRYGNHDRDATLEKQADLRLCLHAHKITFPLPKTNQKISYTAPIPELFEILPTLKSR